MTSPQPPPSPPPVERAQENLEVVDVGVGGEACNPMLIDVILDNVLGYCDFEDLVECRSVSKLWFKVSLPHWLRKGPEVKLHLNPTRYRSRANPPDGKRDMTKFLRLVHNEFHSYRTYEYAGLREYKKFAVQGDVTCESQHQLLQQFLRIYGPCITDLNLYLEFPDLATYRAVVLSKLTPNLVNLYADVNFVKDFEHFVDSGMFRVGQEVHEKLTSLRIENAKEQLSAFPVIGWLQLLKRYPNLQSLAVGVEHTPMHETVDTMLEALLELRQSDKKILNLKHLELSCLDDVTLDCLLPLFRDTTLTLETLRIPIGKQMSNEMISELLSYQAATLKKLIIRKEGPPLKNFEAPQMNFVQDLELCETPFPDLTFLKSFQNLKSLTFRLREYAVRTNDRLQSILNATKEDQLEGLMMPTLSQLKYCYYENVGGTLNPEDIRKLCRVMPNLTDLQLWLNNDTFRAVCQCWPRLQRLCIIGNEVNDEGITGVVPETERNQHNITCLSELESLSMMHFDKEYYDNEGPTAITAKCFPELSELPNLKEIDIWLESRLKDYSVLKDMREKIKTFKCNSAVKRNKKWRFYGADEEDEGDLEDSDDMSDGEMMSKMMFIMMNSHLLRRGEAEETNSD